MTRLQNSKTGLDICRTVSLGMVPPSTQRNHGAVLRAADTKVKTKAIGRHQWPGGSLIWRNNGNVGWHRQSKSTVSRQANEFGPMRTDR